MGRRLCIVGATGAVGTEFIRVLERFRPDFSSLDLVASARSAGNRISVLGTEHVVKDIETYDFARSDVAFFSAGSRVSKSHAPRASAAGCVVVDNTSFFRMDADKKLVVPQINGDLLSDVAPGEIIANPNCSTIQIVKVLHPIEKALGIESAVASTYQAASGAGVKAVDELLVHLGEPVLSVSASKSFVVPLAMNVIPLIDELYDDGWTKEELKITLESRKILRESRLAITATAVRVPVVTGHSVAMYIKTRRPVGFGEFHSIFEGNPEVHVYRDNKQVPTPRFIEDPAKTYVGRVRLNRDDPCGIWTWIVADNLWVGAAYNGYQIAEAIQLRKC